MIRPGHLRASRLRLGLSQREVGAACIPTLEQPEVSLTERGIGPHVDRVARALADVCRSRSLWRGATARRRQILHDEAARIGRQEALWRAVPNSPAKAALCEAMIDRCFDLMCEGRGKECDAIAEWLPPTLVSVMFDAWERWSEGETTEPSTTPTNPATTAAQP